MQAASEAQCMLSNPGANISAEDPIIKVNIEFTDEEGPLKLNFRPFVQNSDMNSKTGEMKSLWRSVSYWCHKNIGNSQENQIDISVSNEFIILTDGKLCFPRFEQLIR